MNIAICDDDSTQLKLLTNYCFDWCKKEQLECKISTYSSAEAFLFAYEDKINFDILLLDIQMNGLSGIDLAKKLRNLQDDVAIIFITGIKDHVFEGYHVQAIDYLLKPINEDALYKALALSKDHYTKNVNYLLVQENTQLIKLKENSICYIESLGHSTFIYTNSKHYKSKTGINDLEKKLSPNVFFKCHRCYLINIAKIEAISKTEVQLEGNFSVPIARGRWEQLNKAFLSYYRSSIC